MKMLNPAQLMLRLGYDYQSEVFDNFTLVKSHSFDEYFTDPCHLWDTKLCTYISKDKKSKLIVLISEEGDILKGKVEQL